MLKHKSYLTVLLILLGMIVTTSVAYSYYFSKNYPSPITNRISFDAKLQFIREHINPEDVDTLIVGSSLALNNVQGLILENNSKSCKKVLNLSMWSIGPMQVEQLLELSDAFVNLKRIIYSGQFSDFQSKLRFKNYDSDYIQQYMTNNLSIIKSVKANAGACNDVSFCLKRQEEWQEKYGMENKFSFLKFDSTGSAPLELYEKDKIKRRWESPHAPILVTEAFHALERMAKKAKEQNIKFYFVQQPYRQRLLDQKKLVQVILNKFTKIANELVVKQGGKFLSLHNLLKMSDKYFADRSHLNAKGSKIGSEEIAKFIDKSEMN